MEIIEFIFCLVFVAILCYWIMEDLKLSKRKKLLINLQIEQLCYELEVLVPDFKLSDYT